MFKAKKRTAVFAAAVISIFCLAGCSGAGDTETQQNALATQDTQAVQDTQTASGSDTTQNGSARSGYYEHGHNGNGNGNHHHNSVTDIGMDQAIAIAVARVPGATENDLREIEREIDGGRIQYEGSIWYGGYEYEFEIDGSTGNILQWEIDD